MKRYLGLLLAACWLLLIFQIAILGATNTELESGAKFEQGTEFEKGKIIDKVICASEKDQSYALYLPSTYTPERTWPIIYAFDPLARGRLPLERFQAAAEKYGYIVAGSNNSSNGNTTNTNNSIKAMWSDTHNRLSINGERVYLTGFSGGARVAIRLGLVLNDQIAGVIAGGAGFTEDLTLPTSIHFSFFGLAGRGDFNFSELKFSDEKLDSLNVARRIEYFDGGHEWPASELFISALEWMDFQALKHHQPRDLAALDNYFNASVARANQLESGAMIYPAYLVIKQTIIDFKGIKDAKDIGELESKLARLKETREVKQALMLERDLEAQQQQYIIKMFTLGNRVLNQQKNGPTTNTEDSLPGRISPTEIEQAQSPLTQLQGIVADLKKRRQGKDLFGSLLASRVLDQYFISLYEMTEGLKRDQKYDQVVANCQLLANLVNDNPLAHFNLACAFAQVGNKKKALSSLKDAIKRGFNDRAAIDNSRSLDTIRNESDFKKIIDNIKN